jgi:hypothetical protein
MRRVTYWSDPHRLPGPLAGTSADSCGGSSSSTRARRRSSRSRTPCWNSPDTTHRRLADGRDGQIHDLIGCGLAPLSQTETACQAQSAEIGAATIPSPSENTRGPV